MDIYIEKKDRISNRQEFNEIYKTMFKSLMLNYSSKYDKNLENFMDSRVRENPNFDEEILNKRSNYY